MADRNPHQVCKELSRLPAKPNEAHEQTPWPPSGTPVVADVQPLGFSPVTEEALAVIVQRLVPALKPHKIIVFGSSIYGAPSPDSDVDLLVIMETHARPLDRSLSVSSVLRPRPFPLDILVKTPEEIEQVFVQGDPFIIALLTQGRVLYARAA
jgi:predicted nucleotidyltransferase